MPDNIQKVTASTLPLTDSSLSGAEQADPKSARPVPAGHLDYIDGFRGLAILMVLLYHVWEGTHLPLAYWWNPLYSGYTGVSLFFVLSGFCLYWPLVRPGGAAAEPTLAEFALRRAHRLLPPYYIAVAFTTLLALLWYAHGRVWPDGPGGGAKLIFTAAAWHLLLLQNLRPSQIFTLDGPMWSLSLEVSLYVAMPLLVVLARRRGIGAAVAVATLVTLVYRIVCDRLVGGTAGWFSEAQGLSFVLVNFLPGQWMEFALGMWAASLIGRNAVPGTRLPLGLGSLFCFVIAAWLSEHLTRYNPFSDSLYGTGYFLLILAASRSVHAVTGRYGALGTVFRWRPLVWLGQISYSVYLMHVPLLRLFLTVVHFPAGPDRLVFVLALFLLIPVIGLSYVFYLACEKPFLNSRKRRLAPGSSIPTVRGTS